MKQTGQDKPASTGAAAADGSGITNASVTPAAGVNVKVEGALRAGSKNVSTGAPSVKSTVTTLGGVEKPKFVPRAQPKKESIQPTASMESKERSQGDQALLQQKHRDNKDSDKRGRHADRGGRDFGRGRDGSGRHGGRDGRGRGRWTMPTGVSFFTGNSSNVPLSSVKPQGGFTIGNDGGSMFDNRTTDSEATIKSEDLKRFDSDSDDEGPVRQCDAAEIWPPDSFTGRDPFSLPFGPKTLKKKIEVTNAPIFAHPDDSAGLEKEEYTSAFVVQLPSELSLRPPADAVPKVAVPSQGNGHSQQEKPAALTGLIGKLQVMKSGKVYLLTNNGLQYEVSAGMDAAFAQYAASIAVTSPAPSSASTAVTSSSSASSGASSKTSKVAPNASGSDNKTGDLHMLTDITRKLLVVPTHAIGKKRVVDVVAEKQENGGAKPTTRPHPSSLPLSFVTEMLMAGAQDGGIISSSVDRPKKGPTPKPSIRIRVSGEDKKAVAASSSSSSASSASSASAAVPGVRFILDSHNNNGDVSEKNHDNGHEKSNDSSKVDLESSGSADIANEDDYYASEFVDQDGEDEEMDVEV